MDKKALVVGGILLLVLVLVLARRSSSSGGAAIYSIAGGDQAAADQAASTIEVARLNAAQGIFSTLAQGFATTQVTGLQEAGATARTQIQAGYATEAAQLAYGSAVAGYNAQVAIAQSGDSVQNKKNFLDAIGSIGQTIVGVGSFIAGIL